MLSCTITYHLILFLFPLSVPGDQQWSILGSHHRGRIPALWWESGLWKPGSQVHECCPPPQRPLCRGKDSRACREAKNSEQEQIETNSSTQIPPPVSPALWAGVDRHLLYTTTWLFYLSYSPVFAGSDVVSKHIQSSSQQQRNAVVNPTVNNIVFHNSLWNRTHSSYTYLAFLISWGG